KVTNSWNVPAAPLGGNGPVGMLLAQTNPNGLGTTPSQFAIWARTFFAACGTEPLGLPPSGGNRLGSVLAVRCPAKLTGSAGSRTVLATTRNCRNAAVPR